MMHTKLSVEAFSAALKRGQGRALLYVRQFGLTGVAHIVLAACLKEPAYDRQCEPGRAAWLFEMFQDTHEYAWFSGAILSVLVNETNVQDVEHLCELAAYMGKNGDQPAADALRCRVLNQSVEESPCGGHALVVLDGIDAIIVLARRYGAALIAHPEEMVSSFEELTLGLDIRMQAEKLLEQLSHTDKLIKAFWDHTQSNLLREQERASTTYAQWLADFRKSARSQFSIQKILQDAKARAGIYPGRYRNFGKYVATKEELYTVLQCLVQETDEQICLRLLWVFQAIPLPELHPRIWQLAQSPQEDVRAAAMVAIGQCRDTRIGEFGRMQLRSANFSASNSKVLELFIYHYQAQDELLIASTLQSISPNDEQIHNFCFSILDIYRENAVLSSIALLVWIYEMSPCTVCRYHAVRLMQQRACLPAYILAEGIYDANVEIQQLIRCQEF